MSSGGSFWTSTATNAGSRWSSTAGSTARPRKGGATLPGPLSLERRGVAVLRYSNLEALRETEAVMEDILRRAAARRRPPSPGPSRKREGRR